MTDRPTYEELEKRIAELERQLDRLTHRSGTALAAALVEHCDLLGEADTALQESEVRFRQLTALSPGGVYQTDPNGDCVYVNDAWLRMAGMSFEQAMGKGWINAVHP